MGNLAEASESSTRMTFTEASKDISALQYQPITGAIADDQPVFLRGRFDAEAGVDTFVSTDGFTRGYIWINGFNLGRYWCVGPQMTLYVPGGILKEKDNVIEIFDVNPKNNPRKVDLLEEHLLEMD
jgi:beta-galactosidase